MMETSNTLNSGMCRCCSSEGTFKDIKTKYHWMGEEEVYADMLTDCFDIKISTPENMDNGICEVCITQLRNAANFKKQVLHTEEQFKRRLQGQDIKNPIKLESVEDPNPIESDHLSDPDFSGPEYDVPIKVELEVKPKAKKRQAKPAASRAKKPKSEAETSSQRVARRTRIITIDATNQSAGVKLTHSPNILRLSRVGSVATKKNQHNLDVQDNSPVIKIEHPDASANDKNRPIIISPTALLLLNKQETPVTGEPKTKKKRSYSTKKNSEPSVKAVSAAEMAKHQHNLETVLLYSNATPTRGHSGIGYRCYFCPEEFPDPANLKTHTLECHHDLKHTSSQRISPLNSYSAKLDITNLTCKLCFKMFTQLADLMDHLRVTHNKFFHTDIKNYIIPFRFDSNPMKCAMCDTEFSGFRMAIEHMNMHYRNHICDVCDSGFVNRAGMRAHKRNHQVGDYPCAECQQSFNSYMKLKYHVRCVHEGKGKRNKCAFCGERFICLAMKNNHLVKEHGVAPTVAKCKACDKTFGSYQSLRVHYNTYHLQIKKFKCEFCEMQFPGSNDLKMHIVKHTGARDFKCDICGKAYGRKRTLVEHLRIHADDRRYKCEHCSMAFVQKCSYKSHLQVKHGIEKGNK